MGSSSVLRWIAAVAFLAFAAPTASAVTLAVVDNGLTSPGSNYGCTTGAALCGTTHDLTLGAPALATGTITINDLGTLASVVLHISYAGFDQSSPASTVVAFSDVTYTASIPIAVYGSSVFQNGTSTGSVSGQANGAPFSVSPTVTNFTCLSISSPSQCGLAFGEAGFTNVQGYDFVHTFNVLTAPVPEPVAGVLVLAGLAGLLLRARRS